MGLLSLPSKALVLRLLYYMKSLLLVPLWKAALLFVNNIYSWFLAAGWVAFGHREEFMRFFGSPNWGNFVNVFEALAQTLINADKQVLEATVNIIQMDASLTAPITLASSVSAMVSAVLTVLLFIKVFDYGMRAIGWLQGTPRLASFSLAFLIWFLIVAAFSEDPFRGFQTLIRNIDAVVGNIYEVTPMVDVPPNSSFTSNQSVTNLANSTAQNSSLSS